MFKRLSKIDRAALFRQRLAQAMAKKSFTQSSLSRDIQVDRSTISQLLSPDSTRLPNAQMVGECARALGVSSDWLLGLSEHPEMAADILAASMAVSKAPRALVDQQIFDWHQEAGGYKIRHVPASLPDMLKTPDMLAWEYAPHLGRTAQQAIGAAQDRLDWMRSGSSDYEIALPLHELQNFAHAQGYYAGISKPIRRGQLQRIQNLHDQLYPGLRMYLFDPRRVWSSPITVFGPLLAVLYLGHDYLAFRDSTKVQVFTRHFDWLVREASISDRQVPDFITRLIAEI